MEVVTDIGTSMVVEELDPILKEHNIETYNNILDIFKEHRSCCVVQPTGTGKSYITMKLMNDVGDKWKIMIAPSRNFLSNLEENEFWVKDNTITLTYQWLGFNSENIAFMLADRGINSRDISLIILDEIHRAGAPVWGKGVKNLIDLCDNAKILGLTATPDRKDSNIIYELFEDRFAQKMNLADAITAGIIPQLSYIIGTHSVNTNIYEILGNNTDEKTAKFIEKELKLCIKNWDFDSYFIRTLSKYLNINETSGKHLIFASSIEEADRIYEYIHKPFKSIYKNSIVKTYNIHSKNKNKDSELEEFFSDNADNEIKVAVSVNMLNESFHCNDMKSISIFRSTQSINVYLQQIGRAITANGDSPYIFDFVDNFHSLRNIEDVIKISKESKSKNNFIFKEFKDETSWYGDILLNIKDIAFNKNGLAYEFIYNKLKRDSLNTIFDSIDECFYNWAFNIVRNSDKLDILASTCERYSEIKKRLQLSIDIASGLSKEWYNEYIKYCRFIFSNNDYIRNFINETSNINISADILKAKKEEYKKNNSDSYKTILKGYKIALILNHCSTELRELLKGSLIETSILEDSDRLKNILNKYYDKDETNKRFKNVLLVEKALNYDAIMSGDSTYDKYRTTIVLNDYAETGLDKSFSAQFIAEACVYRLVQVYNIKYKDEIDRVNQIYKDLGVVERFLMRSKKAETDKLEASDAIEVDRIFGYTDNLNELPEHIRSMCAYHEARTINKVDNTLLKSLGITQIKSNVINKVEYAITMKVPNEKLIEQLKEYREQLVTNVKINMYDWSNKIRKEYNEIITYIDESIKYLEGKEVTEEFNGYIIKTQDSFKLKKSKKSSYSGLQDKKDAKLDSLLNTFESNDEIYGNIYDHHKESFKKEFDSIKKEWDEVYGKEISRRYNLYISLEAVSRIDIEDRAVIKAKLQNAYVSLLEILYKTEEADICSMEEPILYLHKTITRLGENKARMIAHILSKKLRKVYVDKYNLYINYNRITDSDALSFVIDATNKDNDVFNTLIYSKSFGKINEFHKDILSKYNEYLSN